MSISNLVSCKPNSAALIRLHRSYDVRMTREILQSMGKRVRVLREDAGLNQIELAAEVRRRGVSCSNSLVSSIETGRANLSIEVFIAIADALDVTLDYLATRTNVIESPQAESAPTPRPAPRYHRRHHSRAHPTGARRPRRQSQTSRHTKPAVGRRVVHGL